MKKKEVECEAEIKDNKTGVTRVIPFTGSFYPEEGFPNAYQWNSGFKSFDKVREKFFEGEPAPSYGSGSRGRYSVNLYVKGDVKFYREYGK